MAVFQGASNLPEDRCVNVFHFRRIIDGDYDVESEVVRQRVADFYLEIRLAPSAVGAYLSQWLNRDFEVTSYNMSLPAGERTPTTDVFTLPTITSMGLPEEVAICCTLQGAAPVTPRKRGRIYIGPLRLGTEQGGDEAGPCRPNADVTLAITSAAAALASSIAAHQWCIRSVTPTENYVPIAGGYVDNAFDTQRRRGPDPSERASWVPIG